MSDLGVKDYITHTGNWGDASSCLLTRLSLCYAIKTIVYTKVQKCCPENELVKKKADELQMSEPPGCLLVSRK